MEGAEMFAGGTPSTTAVALELAGLPGPPSLLAVSWTLIACSTSAVTAI